MPNRFDFGGVDLTAGENASGAKPSSEIPFCIAILGDFSARASRGLCEAKTIGERRSFLIDRDNFDEVLSSLKVELHLSTQEGVPLIFRFSELEDFHPDWLFEHSAFGKLRGLRERLQNPSTFEKVAAEFGLSPSTPKVSETRADSSRAVTPSAVGLASGSLLDEMIEQTETRISSDSFSAGHPSGKPDDVREFARQVAAKYAVSTPDPRRPEFIAAVDHAIADVMRTVLHHPDFQALEAIWRATFFLVRQLETGAQLKIHLIDITKDELAVDLNSTTELGEAGLFRLLVEKGIRMPGADPWAIIVGNYRFGPTDEDVRLLSRISKIVHNAKAVFVAEASPELLGCSSLPEHPYPREWSDSADLASWKNLRRQPEARSTVLALPRFLLRLPYGERTSPVDSFDFEESTGQPSHDEYLWGNPSFAITLLLGQSFSDEGWQMRPGSISQIEKLPLHIYDVGSGSESKPCAEVLLTEDAVQQILENGLIPLVGFKGRDSVRIVRFQSIADPSWAIAGPWNS
jgi:type VI secretion system protein ImpC